MLALRARRKRYPHQYFQDNIRKGAFLIPSAAFLLALPLAFLLFYDAGQIPGLEEGTPLKEQAMLFAAWAAEYPLTLVFYHTLSARMQRDGFYDSPRTSALSGMALDLLKHGVLLALIFASLLAADQTPNPEKLMGLKNTLERMIPAS